MSLETAAEAREVRGEDAFDVAAVDAWLREHAEIADDAPPEVRQFSGGASNLTYLLRYPDRDLILRRPPPGVKARSAHDMGREFRVQQRLAPVFPYVPEMVAFCDDPAVLGSDFYVMARVEGTIPRKQLPDGVAGDPDATRAMCTSIIDRLCDLHAIDPVAAGLADLGKGEGYVARQVDGWSRRYRDAKTWNVPSFERVMGWLDERQPGDVATCVIHNDFRLDNVVLAGGRDRNSPMRVVGILDWEMATLGDPLMDLGGALAYWVEARDGRGMRLLQRQPTDLPGMLTRDEVVAHYAQRTGRDVEDWVFYEVFGLFRLAVIVQQIYQRYHLKQTRNPAFRNFWVAVHYLDRRCRRVIRERG